jgi:zinc transport system ATP-binding protein
MSRRKTNDACESGEVLRLSHVSFNYGETPVLEDVSLSVNEHDFLGVIGPNGGGKSTLLKLMLGLLQPSHGTVQVCGQTPEQSSHRMGYVPQHTAFDRHFPINVWDVVLMGRLSRSHMLRPYSSDDRAKAQAALSTVGVEALARRPIGELSGGQQQRALIARALVRDPSILLLDEAMASVDPSGQEDMYSLLDELRKRMTIVMVSHNLSAISTYVDKVACLNQRLYYHGSKEISTEDIQAAYGCPVELLAHGAPHRVLRRHE